MNKLPNPMQQPTRAYSPFWRDSILCASTRTSSATVKMEVSAAIAFHSKWKYCRSGPPASCASSPMNTASSPILWLNDGHLIAHLVSLHICFLHTKIRWCSDGSSRMVTCFCACSLSASLKVKSESIPTYPNLFQRRRGREKKVGKWYVCQYCFIHPK